MGSVKNAAGGFFGGIGSYFKKFGTSRELSETHENIVNLHIQIKYYADAEAGSMLKQAVMNIST